MLLVVLIGAGLFVVLKLGVFKFNLASQRLNFVLVDSPVRLVSLDLAKKAMVVVSMPTDLNLAETYHGYGRYNLGSVYAAGELDKRGGEVLSGTVEEYLGVPVDGYIATFGSGRDAKSELLSPRIILSKSDLSFWQRWQILFTTLQVRFDKIKSIDLGESATPLLLADGSTARSLDLDQLDNILGDSFTEGQLRDENLRVEVVNSTGYFGLANRAARILGHIGIDVVGLRSDGPERSSCEVSYARKEQGFVTVRRIAAIFSCRTVPKNASGSVDVTVVLGQDYVSKLTR